MKRKPFDDRPAFPKPATIANNMIEDQAQDGMSLRDWFAGRAMQGLLANRTFDVWMHDGAEMNAALLASNSYEIADAMLARREVGPDPARPDGSDASDAFLATLATPPE